MIAWTNARKLPGVRWCTSNTMAGLPLYLIAIPLRRSLAAGIEGVESLKRRSGGAPSVHALGDFAIVGQAHRLPCFCNPKAFGIALQ
jgi:hypothetical protein